MATVYRKMKQRRDTAANLSVVILASGEIGFRTDTKKVYIGDGVTVGGWLVTGFENPMAQAGAMIVGDTGGEASELMPGTEGNILTMVGGMPTWAVLELFENPMTSAGSLITSDTSGDPVEIGAGTEGYYLRMVSGIPTWTLLTVEVPEGVPPTDTTNSPGQALLLDSGLDSYWGDLPSGLPSIPTEATTGWVLKLDTGLEPYWSEPDEGGGGGASVHIGTTPPGDPATYPLWFHSGLGNLYLYYEDVDSSQWVQIGGGGGSGGSGLPDTDTGNAPGDTLQLDTSLEPYWGPPPSSGGSSILESQVFN